VGGCQDVSLIIDFLGAYLFPNGERTIEEFAATGISLGGTSSLLLHLAILFLPTPSSPPQPLHIFRTDSDLLTIRKRNMASVTNR